MPRISIAPPMPAAYAYLVAMAVIEELPRHLREARQERGVSQRRVALECGLANATVSRAEAGDGIDLDTAYALLAWMAAA